MPETPTVTELPRRWVVFDTETTGTLPSRDKIVSYGALAIVDGEIVTEDSFECVVKFDYNSSAVVVHGITHDEAQATGIPEMEATRMFREYAEGSCLVGHHVAFDVSIVNHSLDRLGMPKLENTFIDLMRTVLNLEEAGLIEPRENAHDFSLDGLCRHFNVKTSGRHTAAGDSLITAMIFLKLLKLAKGPGLEVILASIETELETEY